MGPEESMRIQANLGSDIAMAFDECIKIPSPREYVENPAIAPIVGSSDAKPRSRNITAARMQ